MRTLLLFVILFLGFSRAAFPQKIIEGTVRDAESGETLASSNIIIKDAYRGTITNRDGTYSLSIPDSLLPATVVIRYIGYTSEKRIIQTGSDRQQDFNLQPSVSELEELVVTDEDPGMRIMREVIRRKKQWRSELQTYKAQAYTRQNLSNDTSLVLISESASTIFWDKEKGPREVVTWRRQTANISADQNFSGVRYLPNFYDNNVEIAGFDVVGVTNPDALNYYNFELLEQLNLDAQTVYHIKVIPKRKLQPLFEGEVFVLDDEYALLEVKLKPNSVVRFPPPVKDFNLSYSQQYSNYGGDFWLPVDARINGSVKIGFPGLQFPRFQFSELAKISSYQVNVALPDSLYEKDDVLSVKTTDIKADSITAKLSVEPVPLSREEEHAYATLDSSQTLEKAFQPTGLLARFVDFSVEVTDDGDSGATADSSRADSTKRNGISGDFAPRVRYNRVDEFFGGIKYKLNLTNKLHLSANGGYSTGYNEFSYGGGAEYRWRSDRFQTKIGAQYQAQTATQYQSQIISPTLTSLSNLLGYENYYDYYRDEGFNITADLRDPRSDISLQVGFNTTNQTALETETAYDILGRDRTPRLNPAINEGHLNYLEFKAGYNLQNKYSFGVVGRKRIAFNVEHSDTGLGSDFSFTRYATHLDWSFATFFKRRIFPNTLNVSVDAGTFSGQLPLQKFGIVDVAPNIFSPFEGLRAARFRPYEGEQYAAINIEHNFRTVPFELLGLRPLVKRNIGVIVFGGAAKTWTSEERSQQLFNRTGYILNDTNGTHLEAGASLNGILGLFRVDFTARLDEPAFLVGVGVTRFL